MKATKIQSDALEYEVVTEIVTAYLPNRAHRFFADLEGCGREVLHAFKTRDMAEWYCSHSQPVEAEITIKYKLPVHRKRVRN